MVKKHQHVKFQAIPSMYSPANARKPLRRTDRRPDGWTNGPMYRSKEGISGFGGTDGQPENIMPPASKGGGITITSSQKQYPLNYIFMHCIKMLWLPIQPISWEIVYRIVNLFWLAPTPYSRKHPITCSHTPSFNLMRLINRSSQRLPSMPVKPCVWRSITTILFFM